MSLLLIVGIAVALAMDALAISIASGIIIAKVTPRHIFRLAFHFGLFQALMPVVGWFAGGGLSAYISDWDHWVAFGLLSIIGCKMVVDGLKGEEHELPGDPSRGLMLVSLSIATSIDALAVGLSFAMLEVNIFFPALLIGLITGAISTVGVMFGNRIGNRWRSRAALGGGAVLILIGVKILFSHLT